jgi:Fic family protein
MTRSVRCALPPRIAAQEYVAPPDVADLLARATDRLVDLDRRLGTRTATFDLLLARTEAVSSSRIEEEHATLDDYARALVGIRANGSATAMVGATTALRAMIDACGSGPVTERSVCRAHEVLMRDDPVDGPVAGRWRRVQNWIGGGASPRDAAYVPPPAEDVPAAMADLFAFLARDDVDPLAQAAIAHAQFESVHPFTDGNGRIGRALVNAVLRRRGLTTSLVVPVAAALVADRAGYFHELERYRDGHVDGIVTLTASAIGVVCDEVVFAALRLDEVEHDRVAVHRTDDPARIAHQSDLLRVLLADPVLTEAALSAALPPDRPWTDSVIDELVDAGVLRPVTRRRRDRAWVAADVLAELDALSERIRAAAA